jgi:hypothetical protein
MSSRRKRGPARRSEDRLGSARQRQGSSDRLRAVRSRIGYSLVVLGLVLFLVGNIGARTGLVILPFDPHHVYTQLGGAVLAIVGLALATGGSSKRRPR